MARVAIVTGGTRGIGAAISVGLKEAGCTVAATYGGNDEAANAFKEKTGIHVYKWDVGDFEACKNGVSQVVADLGPVDVLVNNAGITRDTMFHRMKPEQWTAVINTNLNSLFNMCRPLIEGMRSRKFGRIITISSINGQKGQMGQTNYSAAKAGIIGFTKSLAREIGSRNITVNAVAPGFISTDMTDALPEEQVSTMLEQIALGRLGEAEEVAGMVAFLASKQASYITGETININGGMYMA